MRIHTICDDLPGRVSLPQQIEKILGDLHHRLPARGIKGFIADKFGSNSLKFETQILAYLRDRDMLM